MAKSGRSEAVNISGGMVRPLGDFPGRSLKHEIDDVISSEMGKSKKEV